MFAKGDRVRVKVQDGRYTGKADICGFSKSRQGQVGEVCDIFTGGITLIEQPLVRFSDGDSESGFFEELEAVVDTKFAVGDRVTAVAAEPRDEDEYWSSRPNKGNLGRTGIVNTVGYRGLQVIFDNGDTDYARLHYWAKATPAAAFSPGDVVTLKSGGPKMTVERATKESVECTWHLVSGESTAAVYVPEALCHDPL